MIGNDAYEAPHLAGCTCALPRRTCSHESEQHAGNMWHGTGPRRCAVEECNCRGWYIGSTPAACKQGPAPLVRACSDPVCRHPDKPGFTCLTSEQA